ncbi:hypothetical protein LRH25_06445 [Ideonella azotifigens]|nr:hypothetical protein [Ideonella azotifigens]
MKPKIVRLACWVVLAGLAACGGGGGGDAGGGGDTRTTSGLLPAAVTPGATLATDASVFRPMRDQATWTYRGSYKAFSGADATAYTNTVTQSLTAAGEVSESSTDDAHAGSASQTVQISAGTVATPATVDFTGLGNAEALSLVELRSPVRRGEQYTVLDRHYATSNYDGDLDGKADAMDVAIYASVIGKESLSLPNLPTMDTVLVDTTVVSRLQYSSNQQFSNVVTLTRQVWYAAGVGIVRQRTTGPNAAGSGIEEADEQIASWDGLESGLGAMAITPTFVPDSSALFPGQRLSAGIGFQAFAFADHALLLTSAPDGLTPGVTASELNLRGEVTGTRQLDFISSPTPYQAVFVQHAGGLLYLAQDDPNAGSPVVKVTKLDAHGAVQVAVGSIAIDLSGTVFQPTIKNQFAAAVDGSTLWVMWPRTWVNVGVGFVNDLVLQAFDFNGQPLAPEQLLMRASGSDFFLISGLSAGHGSALATWMRTTGGVKELMMTSASVTAGASSVSLAGGFSDGAALVAPFSLADGGALLWPQLPFTTGVTGVGGLRLDSNFSPVRSTANLGDERIASIAAYRAARALDNRVVLLGDVSLELLWPDSADTDLVAQLHWMDTSAAALASTPVSTVRFASPKYAVQLVFPDRVLVIGTAMPPGYYEGLATSVVWLNRGTSLP